MKKRILIADGDAVFVELLTSELEARGLQVEAAFDPVQTLAAAFRGVPDAIVLNVKMPTGLFVLRRLMTSARTSATPIVVVAESADPALPRAAAAFGARAFLRKPVSAEEIHATLRWALGEPEAANGTLPDDGLTAAAGGGAPIPIQGAGNL